MINDYFDLTVNTERLTAISGTDSEDWQANLTDVACQIQPLEDSPGSDLDGSYGKDFLMFCNEVDIIEGDKIVNGSDEYIVKGKRIYDFVGESHLELIIRSIVQ